MFVRSQDEYAEALKLIDLNRFKLYIEEFFRSLFFRCIIEGNISKQKAWKLIDDVGLRGYAVRGASISTKHCNFMINDGTASASDMEKLGEFVKVRVKELSGIELNWEIKRVGRNAGI